MPRLSQTRTFDKTIAQLVAKRSEYANGFAEIDALFAKYGIQLNGATTKPARTTSVAAPSTRRKRQSFSQTAHELVLSIVTSKKHPTTGEINAAWRKAGRSGSADNTLGNLVKEKKLKRTPVKVGRGSTYALA